MIAEAAQEWWQLRTNLLHVANNGTLRHLSNRLDVADGQGGLLAGIYSLPTVQTLWSNEQLLLQPISDGVAEGYLGMTQMGQKINTELQEAPQKATALHCKSRIQALCTPSMFSIKENLAQVVRTRAKGAPRPGS